jgi:large subunit ribosomal protein L18
MKYSNPEKEKQSRKNRRHTRVRAKISGTAERPRLVVFRGLKNMSAQLIDDSVGNTLVSADTKELDAKTLGAEVKTEDGAVYEKKIAAAYKVGLLIAEKAIVKKIKKVVFDKSTNKYHGRVKALADGARKGGLEF